MRQPDIFTASVIKNWNIDTEIKPGLWVPARPVAHNSWSWKWRFKLAWYVLLGKYDVLKWR